MPSDSDRRAVLAWTLGILGILGIFLLALSLAFGPEAMAAGSPLRSIGIVPRACPGCPLCGMSRAFSAVSHLEIARAVAFNPGVLLVHPLAVSAAVAGPWLLARHLLTRRIP